jgi:SAM-dependent methyltransferase
MGAKHDTLTEEEMSRFALGAGIAVELDSLVAGHAGHARNVLDWGCGRGRSVARLIEKGFNAFGVDTDPDTLRNGYPLFEGRGLQPAAILLHDDEITRLPDGFFSLVFSEETLEHVEPLQQMSRDMFRLTAPGGLGLHSFPGSKRLIEPHILMPLVHWLPDNRLRWGWIALCLLLGAGPKPAWPETAGNGLRETVDTYFRYLRHKTHYRDIHEMMRIFRAAGFECEVSCSGKSHWWSGLLPRKLRQNGFPGGEMHLRLKKPG